MGNRITAAERSARLSFVFGGVMLFLTAILLVLVVIGIREVIVGVVVLGAFGAYQIATGRRELREVRLEQARREKDGK